MELVQPPSPRAAFRAGVRHYLTGAHGCAFKCWKHAADIGCIDALFAVAVLGDEPTASKLRMLLTCYDAGHGMSIVMLGLYSYLGVSGLPRDASAAHGYWMKAAGEGQVRALYLLAMLHEERGEYDRAWELLDEAGRMGMIAAYSRLALYFLMGVGGLPKDEDLGMAMLRQASAEGEPTSKEFLIRCYEEGIGVGRDPDAAWRECTEYWDWVRDRPPQELGGGLDLVGWLVERKALET